MSNGSSGQDPLDTHEHINDDNPYGDYLIKREREMPRNLVLAQHPHDPRDPRDDQSSVRSPRSAQFSEEIQRDFVPVGVHKRNGMIIDDLPPVQVLLRQTRNDDTPENRRTLTHQLQDTKNAIRHRMNQEILTQKIKYDNLDNFGLDNSNNSSNKSRSLIESKIRQKSNALNNRSDRNNRHGTRDRYGEYKSIPGIVFDYPEITNVPGGIQESVRKNSAIPTNGANGQEMGENEVKGVIESFTSPGKILNQQEDLLYSNKFDSTTVLKQDNSREFKRNFRRYYEAKREKEEKLDQISASYNDPIKTNNLNFALPSQGQSQRSTIGNQLTNPHKEDRYNKPRLTLITLDSKDRDTIRYPDANSFKIFLGRQFRNVKRVVLISSEFPNTDLIIRDDPQEAAFQRNRILLKCGQVFNDANNHLYWLNDEDAVSPGIYECVFYTADLDPGNYVSEACECAERSLATELEEKVSTINHFDDGTPHQFIVSIDSSTNIVRFLSVESANLAVNPLTTAVGTNVIIVSHPGHPFVVGDTVTITGAEGVGGITSSIINGEHLIQEVTESAYAIRVTQIATSSTTGGGANVLSGQNKPIKLLFSNIDSVGSILGFPQEDSADQIAVDIEFIDIAPAD